jgi:hypothetical protein
MPSIEELKVPLSFPSNFVLWFIGTCLNTVRHPKYGSHQLTLQQLKYAPAKYKDALYKTIAKEYEINPELRKKFKELKR